MRRLAAVAAVALAALAGDAGRPAGAESPECARWRAAFSDMPVRMVTLQAGVKTLGVRVREAATGERQAAGFQCATPDEIQKNLILFDFGDEIVTQFHMNNVPAPLDIAFAKADGRIFAILRMDPSPTKLYGPMGPFRYALEARAGFFESQGIRQGEARLVIPAPR
jgi:uncharacterized membrane protein (UPF0127 family)